MVNEWPQEATKKFLASRLKGAALRWHVERLQTHPRETYREWKNALKEHFKHPADRSKQKSQLFSVKQSPNQPVRHYVDKITNAYNAIYKEQGNAEQQPNDELTALKDDILIKMFIDGLLPPIKTILLNNKYPSTLNWNNVVQAALESEEVVYNTQALETKPLFHIDHQKPEENLESEILKTQTELEELKINLMQLNLSGTKTNAEQEHPVNIVDNYQRGRNHQQNSVKWEDRQQPRDYSRSRDRQGQSYDRNRQRNFDRNRSQSRERSQSRDRYQTNRDNYRQNYSKYDTRSQSPYPKPSFKPTNNYRPTNPNKDATITCHRCLNPGHIAKECRTKEPKRFQTRKN